MLNLVSMSEPSFLLISSLLELLGLLLLPTPTSPTTQLKLLLGTKLGALVSPSTTPSCPIKHPMGLILLVLVVGRTYDFKASMAPLFLSSLLTDLARTLLV